MHLSAAPCLRSEMLVQGTFRFHQFHVVGRHLPTEKDANPTLYRMKLWATDPVRAKSKFWWVKEGSSALFQSCLLFYWSCFGSCSPLFNQEACCILYQGFHTAILLGTNVLVSCCRYFLRKLRKIKRANGQIISINEVLAFTSAA